jgi:hypothetical protein
MDSRTPAQRAASRENGRRGRGPTTEDGKRRSAQNSTKHGLTGGQITVQGEDPTPGTTFSRITSICISRSEQASTTAFRRLRRPHGGSGEPRQSKQAPSDRR